MQRLFLSKSFVYGYCLMPIFFCKEMKQKLHILLIITFALAVALPANAQNDSLNQRIKLHDISIIPPKHFECDTASNKIFHQGSMTSIQIQIVTSRNFRRITSAITDKYIISQGLEPLGKQETSMQNGNEAIIYKCKFKSHDNNGKELYFIRLMLFTGKENTIWTTADFPECIAKQIEEPLTSSIKTILLER